VSFLIYEGAPDPRPPPDVFEDDALTFSQGNENLIRSNSLFEQGEN
jgi:hypothetical protein